jgi:hypothetical protein
MPPQHTRCAASAGLRFRHLDDRDPRQAALSGEHDLLIRAVALSMPSRSDQYPLRCTASSSSCLGEVLQGKVVTPEIEVPLSQADLRIGGIPSSSEH